MLFDAKRQRYPTLYKFIAWLRTKPADETYDWYNCEECACGQFFGGAGWGEKHGDVFVREGVSLNSLACGPFVPTDGYKIKRELHTFGQLLARAERKLEELPA